MRLEVQSQAYGEVRPGGLQHAAAQSVGGVSDAYLTDVAGSPGPVDCTDDREFVFRVDFSSDVLRFSTEQAK
jgi:hypothetical protein